MPLGDPNAAAVGELLIAAGEADAQPSGQAERTELRFKKRQLKPEEGQKIVDEAATWEGTPYLSSGKGENSRKGADGEADCSGSTCYIYQNAGYSYGGFMPTETFATYVTSDKSRFVEIPDIKDAQPGDILFWPGHMAIFAVFPEDFKKSWNIIENKYTLPNMWTARRTGKLYSAMCWETFRKGAVPIVYRYMIEEKE